MKARLYIGENRTDTGEKTNKTVVAVLVSGFFDGFTVLEGTGYWKGTYENVVIVEICSDAADFTTKVTELGLALKGTFNQEAVLLETMPSREVFL